MSVRRTRASARQFFLAGCFTVLTVASVTAPAAITAKQQLANMSESGFQHLQDRARHGDLGAQVVLGVAYEEGLHVQKDMDQAIVWYRRAAQRGDAEVQHHLGLIYEQGLGVVQNFEEAAT